MNQEHQCTVFTTETEITSGLVFKSLDEMFDHVISAHFDKPPKPKFLIRCIPGVRDVVAEVIAVYINTVNEFRKTIGAELAAESGIDQTEFTFEDTLPEFPNTYELHCIGWDD